MSVSVVRAVDYAEATDLLDAYFTALREYNRALGAFDMTPDMIRDAQRREALSYAKVKALRDRLISKGLFV